MHIHLTVYLDRSDVTKRSFNSYELIPSCSVRVLAEIGTGVNGYTAALKFSDGTCRIGTLSYNQSTNAERVILNLKSIRQTLQPIAEA